MPRGATATPEALQHGGGWQNILLNYCRVTCEGLGEAFKAGDTVT